MFEALNAQVQESISAVEGWDRATVTDAMSSVGRARSVVDAFEAALTTRLANLDGDDDSVAAARVRSMQRCSQREADRVTRRARALRNMPKTRKAHVEGVLTTEHVDELIRAAHEASPEEVDGSELIERTKDRPADLARRPIREWAQQHRNEQKAKSQRYRQRERRRFSIFEGDDGMVVVYGVFDSVVGAEVTKRLRAESNRLFHLDGGRGNDERSREQRYADAFEQLVCAGNGASTRKAPIRAQVVVVAESGVIDGTNPTGRCEIPGHGPLPVSELQRLACNSTFTGLLFSGEGEPLWHGREVRLATDAQWRALIARDSGCVGCGLAAEYCEAHHLVSWQPPAAGSTDIDNLALVCSYHHHLIHDCGWSSARNTAGQWSLSPP